MFPEENYFLQLLAYAKDKKQKKNIIKFTNKSQLNVLKNIAKNLLTGDIPLKKLQFNHLKKNKVFLRKLAQGKIKPRELSQQHIIICYIAKIALEHNESRSEVSPRTYRKVGKVRREHSCERSYSENDSSEESISTEESCYSSEDIESDKSTRFGEETIPENITDVSFSNYEEEL